MCCKVMVVSLSEWPLQPPNTHEDQQWYIYWIDWDKCMNILWLQAVGCWRSSLVLVFLRTAHWDGESSSGERGRGCVRWILSRQNRDWLPPRRKHHICQKKDNPTNLPQARPIEDFFGTLLVYAKGWKAENLAQLKRRVQFCLRNLDKEVVQSTMGKVRKLLRKCADNGPFSINH